MTATPGNRYANSGQEARERRLSLVREGVGILLLCLTAYLALAIFSFHPDDPSFNQSGDAPVRNLAGVAGAYLADALLQLLGFAGHWLPLIGGTIGWRLLRGHEAAFYWDRLLALPTFFLATALLCGLLLPGSPAFLPAGPGGVTGHVLGGLLTEIFGPVGSFILLFPLWLLSFMVLTRFSLVGFLAWGREWLGDWQRERALAAPATLPPAGEGRAATPPPALEPVAAAEDGAAPPVGKGRCGARPAPEAPLPKPAPAPAAPVAAVDDARDGDDGEAETVPPADSCPTVADAPPLREGNPVTSLLNATGAVLDRLKTVVPSPAEEPRREPVVDPRERIEPVFDLDFDAEWEADPLGDDDSAAQEGDPAPPPTPNGGVGPHERRALVKAPVRKPAVPPAVPATAVPATAGPATAGPATAVPATAVPALAAPAPVAPAAAMSTPASGPADAPQQSPHGGEEEVPPWAEEDEELAPWPEAVGDEPDDDADDAPPEAEGDEDLPPLNGAGGAPYGAPIVPPALKNPTAVEGGLTAEQALKLMGPAPLPPMDLLERETPGKTPVGLDRASLDARARLLEQKLADFKVKGRIVGIHPGPVVTTFELDPAPGLKASKVIGLADDLARSISVIKVRVVGNIPGKSVIGLEVPNESREMVYLRSVLESEGMARVTSPLGVALGSGITGAPVVADIARMPHLLVAGTTGSGKSVAVNAMICSILFRARPEKVRMLMVDPKQLELSIYNDIPHLLSPVVTDVRKASNLLKWAVAEMEDRYRLMSEMGVRNLAGFNKRVRECLQTGDQPTRRVKTGFEPTTGKPIEEEEPIPLEELPIILIIIDELADLMLVVGKEVEPAIARLAQMARAAGIHMIIATQSPRVNVLTGLIKANFPTRLAFMVSSKIDSRVILDTQGAENLLGMGDGLFQPPGTVQLQRIHAPFVSDDEVMKLVKYLKSTGRPDYNPDILLNRDEGGDEGEFGGGGSSGGGDGDEYDELYDHAVAAVLKSRKVSTSMVQRHFKIGYNRAARIVERMEEDGLVSPANASGKREVLAPSGPQE